MSDNSITTIFEDKAGSLWIGTNDRGLNKLNPAKETFTYYQPEENNSNSLVYECDSGELSWQGIQF